MKLLNAIILILSTAIRSTNNKLIRDFQVYFGVIATLSEHYNARNVYLVYSTSSPVDFTESTDLLTLQTMFSRDGNIPVVLMDFTTLTEQMSKIEKSVDKPFIILLSDEELMKEKFEELSTMIWMSNPIWLIFFGNTTVQDDYFALVDLPFDCAVFASVENELSDGETLIEVYRVNVDSDLNATTYGHWNSESGLQTPQESLNWRRISLHGSTLRVVTLNKPPLTEIVYDSNKTIVGLNGLFGEIWSMLELSMNFSSTFEEIDRYLVDEFMIYKKADAAVLDRKLQAVKHGCISFTTQLFKAEFITYVKKPPYLSFYWDAYTAPLDVEVWLTLIGLIILISFITTATIINMGDTLDSNTVTFRDTLLDVFKAFCNQGLTTSNYGLLRYIHLVTHLSAVLVLGAYSAFLISSLSSRTVNLPFTTLAGLVEDGSYKFGVSNSSAEFRIFKNAEDDAVLKTVRDKFMVKKLPLDEWTGLKRVCTDEKFSFLCSETMFRNIEKYLSCQFVPLDIISEFVITFDLSNKSPYLRLFNKNLNRLREFGILQRILNPPKYIDEIGEPPEFLPVEVSSILPLVLLLCVFGYGLATLVLFIEITMSTARRSAKNKVQEKIKSRKTSSVSLL